MRLLAAAVIAGLALVAGSVVYSTPEPRDADPYADTEEIVSAWLNAAGESPQSVRRVSGPFVIVKFGPGLCLLVDVSTQYEGDGGLDSFWAAGAGPNGADFKSVDC